MPGETVGREHRMLVGKMSLEVKKMKKVRVESRIRWWKINEEVYNRKFRDEVKTVLGDRVEENRRNICLENGDEKVK